MPKPRASGLRFRLMLLVVMAILPMLGLLLYQAEKDRELELQRLDEESIRIAEFSAGSIGQVLEGTRQMLRTLAFTEPVRAMDSSAANPLFADVLKKSENYANLGLTRGDGLIMASALPAEGVIYTIDSPWFTRLQQTRKPSLGNFQQEKVSGKACVIYGWPLSAEIPGQPLDSLFVTLNLSALQKCISQPKLPHQTAIVVLDRNGIELARHPDSEKWVGRQAKSWEALQKLGAQPGGFVEAKGLDGVFRRYYYLPVPESDDGLFIAVGMAKQVMLARITADFQQNLLWLAVFTLIAVGSAWLIADWSVLRYVNRLTMAARRLARGDWETRASMEGGARELQQLARAFDEMAAALCQNRDWLEERVEQRTLQLSRSNENLRMEIAERKQMQEALFQEQHLLQMLMEHIPAYEFIYFKDAESRFIRICHSMAKRLGLKDPSEAVGKTDFDFFGHDHADKAREEEQQIMRTGRPIEAREEIETWPDRPPTWAVTTKIPLFDHDGHVIGTFGISRDITEMKRKADLSLRAQRTLLLVSKMTGDDFDSFLNWCVEMDAQVMEIARISVWWLAEDGSEIVCAEAFDSITGEHTRNARLQRGDYPRYFAALDENRVLAADDTALDGRTAEFSQNYLAPQGIVSLLDVPIRQRGRVVGILCHEHIGTPRIWDSIEQDFAVSLADMISLALESDERKRAETGSKKLLHDLERSNKELEQFAYVASHDLQEPLRLVSAYTQLLLQRYRDKLDADADPIVNFITEGVNRMQQLIQDLLAYSRVSSRNKPLTLTKSETALENALRNLGVALRESQAEVTHDELPTLFCEASQLTQLFQNLIGNGIKFHGDQPPRIHVSAEKIDDGAAWRFAVRDNGIGIDPEYFERIFIIFQRLHTRSKYPGTGIGLAICKRIVEQHRGKIWVESCKGNGATFFFTIPTNPDTL